MPGVVDGTGVLDGSGTANQHSIRHQLLEPCRYGEYRIHFRGSHRVVIIITIGHPRKARR